jgi:enoyl-CoA hydratase/carnithine racemase
MQDFAHTVNVTQDGAITTLQFESDHPANVFTLPLLEELVVQIEKLSTDASCRALVIKGRDKIFSGGADLTSIQAMDPHTYRTYVEVEYHLFRQVELLPFITIASISGACVGNGAELAMACDLRVASDRAKIGWPELNVAFDAPAQRLARFVGIGRAKEIVFSARLLRADEAHALGLLTTVVAPDDLADATHQAATLYASRPPVGVRLTKENIERAYPFASGNASLEIDAAARAFATADFQEGADAVLNRRDPVFTGR